MNSILNSISIFFLATLVVWVAYSTSKRFEIIKSVISMQTNVINSQNDLIMANTRQIKKLQGKTTRQDRDITKYVRGRYAKTNN